MYFETKYVTMALYNCKHDPLLPNLYSSRTGGD